MAKAHARQPDWMTFNGYSGQYVKHPLTAKPGDLVRFWVVDAGPSIDTDFHIVGTILNTAYPFGDMHAAHALHNVQTVTVPAGGAPAPTSDVAPLLAEMQSLARAIPEATW